MHARQTHDALRQRDIFMEEPEVNDCPGSGGVRRLGADQKRLLALAADALWRRLGTPLGSRFGCTTGAHLAEASSFLC
jgi:hypothetical protein